MAMMTAEARLPLPIERAMWVCRDAADTEGCGIDEMDDRRIVMHTGLWRGPDSHNPIRIEVDLTQEAPSTTLAEIHARMFGFGPIAKKRLRRCVARVQNAIERAARSSTGDRANRRARRMDT